MSPTKAEVQATVTRRYDRVAPFYDALEAPMEWMGGRRRRQRLLSQAHGRVLEIGVGTGRNLVYYPASVHDVTAVDVSRRMLARAEARASRASIPIILHPADVSNLPFASHSFDTVVATSVFCSVARPIDGLREVGRVVKTEGKILLLEHVRPRRPVVAKLADLLNPLTSRLFGFNLNRRTEDNVVAAGLRIVDVRRSGVWREMVARPDEVKR